MREYDKKNYTSAFPRLESCRTFFLLTNPFYSVSAHDIPFLSSLLFLVYELTTAVLLR